VLRLFGRYVFREVLASAAIGTLLATFVVFLHAVNPLFDLLVASSLATVKSVGLLFLYAVPPVLPLTIPFGVLVGILIGLGRMAADGEIVAMRASGVASRKVIAPVLAFAALGMGCAAFASLRLTPLAMRQSAEIVNQLIATDPAAQIQPRVFDEDFPNIILYVGDVRPGAPVRLRPVFLADVTPPEQRKSGMKDRAVGPMVTTAREAVAVSDPGQLRVQLSMRDAATHEMGKDSVAHDASAPRLDYALDAAPAKEKAVRSSAVMNTRQLIRYNSGPELLENKIELHKRFALPVACIMLAMVGIPLGIATRKGGRSAGYVNAIVLSFFCYYLALISLMGLARQRTLPVPVAIWLPDAVFGLAGVALISRMERPGDRDLLASLGVWFAARVRNLKSLMGRPFEGQRLRARRLPLLPQILDAYLLSRFLLYFALLLASLVSLTLIYNFFELTPDMVRNHIPLLKMFTYLFFLSPELIYRTLPISVLVAVLAALGTLSKQNEIIAFLASGVSLYRLALPILLGGVALSAGLFAFDYYYLPDANRKQEALRAEIKGTPTQTYLNPERKWIMGRGSRIYYYRYFDPSAAVMNGVTVFELDPATFRMVRQIAAERASWSPFSKQWVFENGWKSDFQAIGRTTDAFQVATFPELTEEPGYFLKEAMQDKQMNFAELDAYIRDLSQSGFETVKLRVEFFRKFSVPLFALIMALIAVPFGFMVGNRGAMAGIGVSIGIAMAYWGIGTLFEKAGGMSQLSPVVAAWSPDAIFALAGSYLFLRLRS
jgi:LPS export ABC transporter permease LptG/LPS export ABC transporter permease LptF